MEFIFFFLSTELYFNLEINQSFVSDHQPNSIVNLTLLHGLIKLFKCLPGIFNNLVSEHQLPLYLDISTLTQNINLSLKIKSTSSSVYLGLSTLFRLSTLNTQSINLLVFTWTFQPYPRTSTTPLRSASHQSLPGLINIVSEHQPLSLYIN